MTRNGNVYKVELKQEMTPAANLNTEEQVRRIQYAK